MAALKEREFTLPMIKKQTPTINRVLLGNSSLKSLDLGTLKLEGISEKGFGHALYAGAGEADDRFNEVGGGDSSASQEDDSAEGIRRRAERAAEFEVDHNWMLKEAEERQYKKFDSIKRRVTITVPDEDPIENINHRLAEVRSMVKPRAEMSDFLQDMDSEQMEKIMNGEEKKITEMNLKTVKEERRKGWRPRDLLKHAVGTVLLIAQASVPRRRHFNEEDPEAPTSVLRRLRRKAQEKNNQQKPPFKSSLSFDMQLAMSTQPEYRSNTHLKRVMWVMRTTKAFKHLFPAEMEKEVARVVAYERYDDNRHIAYQGRAPERFYYVLSGRIQRLREYRLTSGCINKPMGYLSKGMTSNPDDVENAVISECHLVAKGPVEVLILQRDDFIRLQHTTQNPPIDFLWSLDLFKEFPCEQFQHNQDAIEFTYYGQHRMIAKDAHNSPWIYVVKSGNVKVVRVQFVVDVRNDTTFASQNTEELGCGRAFSHATEMLGILAKQRKMKEQLPDININERRLRRKRSSCNFSKLMRRGRNRDGLSAGSTTDRTHDRKKHKTAKFMDKALPPPAEVPPVAPSPIDPSSPLPGSRDSSSIGKRDRTDFQLPPIVVTQRTPSRAGSRGSATLAKSLPGGRGDSALRAFLTREITEAESILSPRKKKDLIQRRAYLQLDLLSPGDVFGLDDIAEKFRYHPEEEEGLENLDPPPGSFREGPAINLVSDGAEIVKISKRFFLQFAQNNTMLRVETMQREYISTDEAKEALYDKETWRQYKTVLLDRIVGSLTSRT